MFILKAKLPFNITKARVIEYSRTQRGKVTISVIYTYSGLSTEVEVLKPHCKSYKSMDEATVLPEVNHVSKKKSQDIAKLLTYISVPDDAKLFYEAVLKGKETNDTSNTTNAMEPADAEEI